MVEPAVVYAGAGMDGHEVVLGVGKTLRVELETIPTAGYVWQVTGQPDMLALTAEATRPTDPEVQNQPALQAAATIWRSIYRRDAGHRHAGTDRGAALGTGSGRVPGRHFQPDHNRDGLGSRHDYGGLSAYFTGSPLTFSMRKAAPCVTWHDLWFRAQCSARAPGRKTSSMTRLLPTTPQTARGMFTGAPAMTSTRATERKTARVGIRLAR